MKYIHYINSLKKYLSDSDYRFLINSGLGLCKGMSDKEYITRMFKIRMGYNLDLDNPKTFNEKIQWLKLYDRKPIYTSMVDKYTAKQYVADRIGEEYIIPTLGVWDKFDDIDFDDLPNQFVLKCTHDSGGLVICRDKNFLDKQKAKEKIERSLKKNYYWSGREWPYKDVKPRIIAEQYMEDTRTEELRDYKFFCFDGVAKALFIATERQKEGEEVKFDFYDMNFKHLDFRQGHPNAAECPAKPETFNEMRKIAERLSKGIPHLRVDFYEVNGKAYFGELTFSHFSGMVPFDPEEWDTTFGEWIKLPEIYGGGYSLIADGFVLWIHEQIIQKTPGLTDYKFFCFNNEVKMLYVSRGLEDHTTARISFYDPNGNEMPFHRKDYKPLSGKLTLPDNYPNMLESAKSLANAVNAPFVRIDLYSIAGKTKFSEITFSPCSGMIPFDPVEWDENIGDWLRLPLEKK